eukprot:TRINITY_DN2581_c0_g1_i1.p1 TRINITY_DN2581_c0_g1~~TRINITY_DN2581_c0_g1_i1.p1  ORF type:complete len:180 (+),score=43.45 TRINITY_DN2581_c0_g1_i1:51-590(+)
MSRQQGGKQSELDRQWQEFLTELKKQPGFYSTKHHELPLARIKKIMKNDEDVSMISGEALSLFAKACELFILDLTMRSWANAEENKRKTLQRSNVAAAVTQCEMFDFLIDIIPRDELTGNSSAAAAATASSAAAPPPTTPPPPSAAPVLPSMSAAASSSSNGMMMMMPPSNNNNNNSRR